MKIRLIKMFLSRSLNSKPRVSWQTYSHFSSITKSTETIYKPKIYSGGDFEELVKQSTIIVDKTLFIKEIIESEDKVSLIAMPRRWGKSLNLDMLRRFLEI
jgi:hypothetical protein